MVDPSSKGTWLGRVGLYRYRFGQIPYGPTILTTVANEECQSDHIVHSRYGLDRWERNHGRVGTLEYDQTSGRIQIQQARRVRVSPIARCVPSIHR